MRKPTVRCGLKFCAAALSVQYNDDLDAIKARGRNVPGIDLAEHCDESEANYIFKVSVPLRPVARRVLCYRVCSLGAAPASLIAVSSMPGHLHVQHLSKEVRCRARQVSKRAAI